MLKSPKVKPSHMVQPVGAFGESGAVAKTYNTKFRTFSVYNTAGACTVTMADGNVVNVPEGITVSWDAGSQDGVINRFYRQSFAVSADDCIVVATI
jgi:hypothetical protein